MFTLRSVFVSIVVLAICTAAHAVDFGWQEMPEGGIEYIVQVEPALLDGFRQYGFTSEIPRGTQEIRRIKLVVGEEKLPNEGTLPPPVPVADPMDKIAEAAPHADASKSTEPKDGVEPTAFDETGAKPIGGPFESMFNRVPNSISTPADGKPDDPPAAKAPVFGQNFKPQIDEPRPWMPLMLALVALFASLGANAYLVWIHQTLRANYRSLVARMTGGSAA